MREKRIKWELISISITNPEINLIPKLVIENFVKDLFVQLCSSEESNYFQFFGKTSLLLFADFGRAG